MGTKIIFSFGFILLISETVVFALVIALLMKSPKCLLYIDTKIILFSYLFSPQWHKPWHKNSCTDQLNLESGLRKNVFIFSCNLTKFRIFTTSKQPSHVFQSQVYKKVFNIVVCRLCTISCYLVRWFLNVLVIINLFEKSFRVDFFKADLFSKR